MFLPVPPKKGGDIGSQLAYLIRSLAELGDLAEGLHRQFELEDFKHHKCKAELARCQECLREATHKPVDKDLDQ